MNDARIKYISSMLIFGSMGLVVRMLPFSSPQIALARGLTGCLFLLVLSVLFRKHLSPERIRADFLLLLLSGASIGINWILLFQSYRYTSISNATICYYMAPVIVVLMSPLVLKEKITPLKIISIAASLLGIILITGWGESGRPDRIGILYGLGAALFYAAIILLNQFFRRVTDLERTILQLAAGAVTLLPYVMLTSTFEQTQLTLHNILLLLVIGIVHTGLAYYLYFAGLRKLTGQTAALCSYLDPLTAILLSALFLSEPLGWLQMAGGGLILGSAFLNSIMDARREAKKH